MSLWNSAKGPLVVVLAGTLGACAAVGPNFQSPAAPTAAGYAMTGDDQAPDGSPRIMVGQSAAGAWWRAFGSPELDSVVSQAVAGNPSLAAANATLAQAQAELGAARGALYPQLDANAGIARDRVNLASFGFTPGLLPGLNGNPTFNLYSVGATVSYAIDVFGGTRRAIESAAAQAETRTHQRDAAYLALTGNVATQAAKIAALRAQLAVLEAVVADDRRNIDLVGKALAAGGEIQLAKVSAESQLAEDAALIPPMRQDLAAARHALAVMVGKAPADWTAPDFDLSALTLPTAIPVSLPSELVRKRPDILAAEAELHAATANVGVATAQLYPSLNITGGFQQGALSPGDLLSFDSSGYNLGLGLTAPLFDGGRRRAERQAAIAAADVAAAQYRRTVLSAFGQVADTLQALAHDEETINAQAAAETAAEHRLRLTRASYQAGGDTLLSLVDAERQYDRARIGRVHALGQRYIDAMQLFVATGADWTKP